MNMLKHISLNILRQLFRKKGSILVLFVLPVVGLLVPVMMFSSAGQSTMRVGYVDLDKGAVSQALITSLSGQTDMQVTDASAVNIETALSDSKLDVVLTIPAGFEQSLLAGTPQMIQIQSIQGASMTAWVKAFSNFYLGNVETLRKAAQGDQTQFNILFDSWQAESTKIERIDVKDVNKSLNITYLGMGFLIQFMLVNAGRTASLILDERKNLTLSRMRISPIRANVVISSNVLVNVGVVTLQTLASLIVLRYILNVETGAPIWQLLLLLLPLNIAGVAVCLMLVSLAKDQNQLGTLLTIFVYPTCLLSGCFWDIQMMPPVMQKIAWFLPQRWALDGIIKLFEGQTLMSLMLNIGVLLAFALAFFAVSVFGFSRTNPAKA